MIFIKILLKQTKSLLHTKGSAIPDNQYGRNIEESGLIGIWVLKYLFKITGNVLMLLSVS